MSKKIWTTEDKIRIVMEHLNTNIEVAEMCRSHNLSPRTFYMWKERFLQGGRSSLAGKGHERVNAQLQKEIESLKKIIGEYAVSNAVLKKTLEAGKR